MRGRLEIEVAGRVPNLDEALAEPEMPAGS
jgi:hypothetical protein